MVKHTPGHKTAKEYKVLKIYKVVTEAMIETIRLQMKLNKTKYQKPGMVLKKNKKNLWIITGDNKIAKVNVSKLFCKFGKLLAPLYMKFCIKTGDVCL